MFKEVEKVTEKQLKQVLKEKFNLEEFRPGQMEAMQTLFQEHRLLCIQPTGYGKSLLYQLPSCLLGGITVVISPLLALIRDQIDQLTHRFNISATSINSDQTEEENQQARDLVLAGKAQILFVSPEQIDHTERFAFLTQLPISLLVIDEAHCISTWGHDFRPSYRQILTLTRALEQKASPVHILALTATADTRVEKDITQQLSPSLKPMHVWREKMDRPNLHLSVIPVSGVGAKLALCHALLAQLPTSGLIYCATREHTELVADYLKAQGVDIIAYHAGLASEEKRTIQFGFSRSQYRVIAATTALGMGVDKKDLRFIIHFDIPGSITAYYQEIGRAGRDGLKAEAILLYDPVDRKVQDHFINSALPTLEDFQGVLDTISGSQKPPRLMDVKRITGLHPTRVTIVLAELAEQGFIKKSSLDGAQTYQLLPNQAGRTPNLQRYTTQSKVKREELNTIISYAQQGDQCRMLLLREALGDEHAASCGRCDLCLNIPPPALPNSEDALDYLTKRLTPIASTKREQLSQGFSLFSGELRTPPFLDFMHTRRLKETVDPQLLALLVKNISLLPFEISGIITIPSRTWKAQIELAEALASQLKLPLLSNLLKWKVLPTKRQGELLNNDQRHDNVHKKMQTTATLPPSSHAWLLLDDYIGSGATIREAARALRETSKHSLIPVTIASVTWKLGTPGFV